MLHSPSPRKCPTVRAKDVMNAPMVAAGKPEGSYLVTSMGCFDSSSSVISPSALPSSSAAAFSSNRSEVLIAGSGDACRRS